MALLTYEYNNCINMQSQRILIYNILLKESYLRHLSSFEGHSSNENNNTKLMYDKKNVNFEKYYL